MKLDLLGGRQDSEHNGVGFAELYTIFAMQGAFFS